MAKKPAKPEPAPPASPAGPRRAMSTTTMAIIVLAIVTLGATFFLTRSGEAPSEVSPPAEVPAASQTPAAAPASDAVPASAKFGPHQQDAYPPLPETGFAPPRPMDTVRAVYQFAAEHPEVLGYIPCYCGCDRQGHKGNDDCFVAQRDAKGDVTAWDGHGMTWAVCIDIARDAMQMYASGASVRDIRAATEKKWGSQYPTTMHTPMPR